MKKLSLLFAVVLLLSVSACQSQTAPETTLPTVQTTSPAATTVPATTVPETTVPEITAAETFTLYIPETMSIVDANGTALVTVNYLFEEGWQEKETFTLTYGGEGDIAQMLAAISKVTYGDKHVITDTQGSSYLEVFYDETGRVVKQITIPANNQNIEKMETTMTYDEHGRLLTQQVKTYASGVAEPQVNTQTYVCTETDTGSKSICADGSIRWEREYDKNYRCVKTATIINGEETTRTENTYDADGNLISSASYANGQLAMVNKYTFTAVEVSAQTAARLPQLAKNP